MLEKKRILLTDVPNDYIYIASGLGERRRTSSSCLSSLKEVKAVISRILSPFSEAHMTFLDTLTESIVVLNTIQANTRTEHLLTQSQSLASGFRCSGWLKKITAA